MIGLPNYITLPTSSASEMFLNVFFFTEIKNVILKSLSNEADNKLVIWLVVFYGISTLVGYLKAKSSYIQ